MRLHHIAIRVTDLSLAYDFYSRVIGLREVSRPREGAIWLDAAGVILMLEQCEGARVDEPFVIDRPQHHLVAFSITASEREEWLRRFAEHNIPIVHETGFTLYVRDPDGNRLGFSHYPDAQ